MNTDDVVAGGRAESSGCPMSAAVLAHGYTLTDLHHMAAAACRADRSLACDVHTRYDIAWSAIALHLATAAQPPGRPELVRTGWQAIYAEIHAMRRMFGVRDENGANRVASAPRFVQYWTRPPADPEEDMVERVAVGQVLAALGDRYRDAVVALAVHGNYQAAADSLGISYGALIARMGRARQAFRVHWYAPDTPPPMRGTDRRVGAYGREAPTHCSRGHKWTPENTRWQRSGRARGARARLCRTCERDRHRSRRSRGTEGGNAAALGLSAAAWSTPPVHPRQPG